MSNSLAVNTPQATPAPFPFEGREWKLWPLDTEGVAAQLERWVAQHVRANVEKLRPADDDEDPLSWRVYNEDKVEAQRAIQRGEYNALMPAWFYILSIPNGPGFAEAIYQCVRFKLKEGDWTREHVKRLLAGKRVKIIDDKRVETRLYDEIYALFDEINFPKARGPGSTDPPPEKRPSESRSTGNDSSPEQRSEESSQANSSLSVLAG